MILSMAETKRDVFLTLLESAAYTAERGLRMAGYLNSEQIAEVVALRRQLWLDLYDKAEEATNG